VDYVNYKLIIFAFFNQSYWPKGLSPPILVPLHEIEDRLMRGNYGFICMRNSIGKLFCKIPSSKLNK